MGRGLEARDISLIRRDAGGVERTVLHGISTTFPAGAVSLIAGPVGSGKSTLLHVLCTLLRPSSGQVFAKGEPISRYTASHRDRWRRQAGIALQSPRFLTELSALENVIVPLVPVTPSIKNASDRAMVELERLEVGHLAHRRASELSGGERARVALARALVNDPGFVFADEPSSHQHSAAAELVLTRLASEAERGATVVVVSHDAAVRSSGLIDRVFELGP